MKSGPVKVDPLAFVDELTEEERPERRPKDAAPVLRPEPRTDDLPTVQPLEPSPGTPTTVQLAQWDELLGQSPVFKDTPSGRVFTKPPISAVPTVRPIAQPASSSTGAAQPPVVAPLAAPVVAPVVAPTVPPTIAPSSAAPPVLPPLPPTVQPLAPSSSTAPSSKASAAAAAAASTETGLASALAFEEAGDRRTVDIAWAFEQASAVGDDEPVVNLLVTLQPAGPPLLDASAGPVAHVVLALDVSASMNRTDKYPLLTEALAGMLYDLRRPGAPDVLLSVVVYAYGAETIFRDRLASQLDPREVLTAIDRSKLRFGRYTDMVGALERAGRIAYDQVRANKAMPTRICLLTDGRPQDVDGTRAVMERIAKLPVDVDALAFGRDADVAVLQELVSGGRGGTVKQIRSDTIGEAFAHVATTATAAISNRALFELELRPGVVGGGAYRYRPARHRFRDGAFDGGRTFRTDLGTLEAGRAYSLFFELRLPTSKSLETEVGRITLRIPGHGGPRTFESLVAIQRHRGALAQTPDREVQTARDVLAALGATDPKDHLRALKTRRSLYERERRDPALIAVLDRAIEEIEQRGNLDALGADEKAALISHTASVGRVR